METGSQVRKQSELGIKTVRGMVFNIQDYCIHDGPGIRTTVFLKGCPLNCHWCSNPESKGGRPELGFISAKCTKCGKCPEVCPEHAITIEAGQFPVFDRARCTVCGKCIDACIPNALAIYGKEMTDEELFEQVRKDEIFYRGSGGGVTVSGGEPLQQPELLMALFQRCRHAGIHTAIETTGHTRSRVLEDVLALTDYVLFDLKHMDPEVHERYTSQPNDLILANARLVAASGIPFLFRMPLIPEVNDSKENIEATAAFIKGLGKEAARIELLPYHRMGSGKYEGLGATYLLKGVMPPDLARVEEVKRAFEDLGATCTISR
ncbi:MAG: glycyl-radical enzyme activating protein [Chloroflexi bacterium]|nr:glycyl-radical enzyme activating protein [Chloroflexota bacterium]